MMFGEPKTPYPGFPLVAVDTKNHTGCQTEKGSYSRFNEKTAQFCVSLARDAVRSGIESIAIISPHAAHKFVKTSMLVDKGRLIN